MLNRPSQFLNWFGSNSVKWVLESQSSIAAAIFGVLLRSIPEIWAGPNLIGFDTVYYAGEISRLGSCLGLIGQPEEMTLGIVACPLAMVTGPILAMKIYAVLLYGFFGWSVFFFARRELEVSPRFALFVSMFVLLQIASLRLSLDLYRNLFALSLLLLLLSCFKSLKGKRRVLLVAFLSMAIAVTHQLVMGVLLLVFLGIFAWALFKRELANPVGSIILLLSLILLTALSLFLVFPTTLNEVSTSVLRVGDESENVSALVALLAALYLPTAIPAIIGLRRIRSLLVWAMVVMVPIVLSFAGFTFFAAFFDRWSLMLLVPIGVFGALGIGALGKALAGLCLRLGSSRDRFRVIRGIMILVLLMPYGILAGGFMTSPLSSPYWYFDYPALWRAGASGLPSTMQHNTMPFGDVDDAIKALDWLNVNMGSRDVLLTHPAFYGWALLHLRRDRAIINYGYNGIEFGLLLARQSGFHDAYAIWFVPGHGWHEPDPNFTSWKLVLQEGAIVIYLKS